MNIDFALDNVRETIDGILGERAPSVGAGKMTRARLFFSFSGNDAPRATDIATCLELLHAATLVHDDIIDNASLRRGRPPLYRHKGVSGGILYGDYLFARAFELLSGLEDHMLNKEMTQALSEVLEGEILGKNLTGSMGQTKSEYLGIISKKTGALFGVTAKLGALERGWDKFSVRAAGMFGRTAGTAYQITDDLLDYTGPRRGKDKFNDIKEGTATLPLIYLAERCSPGDLALLREIFGNSAATVEQMEKVTEMMRTGGIIKETLNYIEDLLNDARELIGEEQYHEISEAFDILAWIKLQAEGACLKKG